MPNPQFSEAFARPVRAAYLGNRSCYSMWFEGFVDGLGIQSNGDRVHVAWGYGTGIHKTGLHDLAAGPIDQEKSPKQQTHEPSLRPIARILHIEGLLSAPAAAIVMSHASG
jgi:hypothetical protein